MGKKFIKIASIIVGVIIIGIGIYAFHLYSSVKDTAKSIYQPIDNSSAPHDPLSSNNAKIVRPITILLMGVDERQNDRGRSDTLIVMTLNPEKKTMQMVSIPRDTRTEIAGRGSIDKINAAYAYGGTKMAVDTVEKFLNININYYIRINMEGLSELVDNIGGVTVNNDISWPGFPKGVLTLNGKQALAYTRMRHQDPRGDFGRNKRQRDVIAAVINKMSTTTSFTHYQAILNAISNNVKTDLTLDDMKYIASHYRTARKNIVTYEIKGQGAMINHIYYLLVSNQERQKVTQMIKSALATTQ